MHIRFCGMCGEPARPISAVRLLAEQRTIETRWCPHCGALGLRERSPDATVYETWEMPRAQRETLESDITSLMKLVDPEG